MDQILATLQSSLISIVLVAITVAATIAIAYIRKLGDKVQTQIQSISDESTRALAESALEDITNLCETTVKSLEQEVASEIRKKLASGDTSVSRDDLIALKDVAVNTVMNQIAPEVQQSAMTLITDVEAYVISKVSASLYDVKNSNQVIEALPLNELTTEK